MAENEVGRISLGVELSTAPLSSQAAEMEREVISIAEKAGEKAERSLRMRRRKRSRRTPTSWARPAKKRAKKPAKVSARA